MRYSARLMTSLGDEWHYHFFHIPYMHNVVCTMCMYYCDLITRRKTSKEKLSEAQLRAKKEGVVVR